ncbi:uncharacterized protein BP5553_03687 [Venustampulla echinocandica]|uniref:Uncharacterized protein n=1 Tax=Venustampulla echinocandica TaxID=2656787 RepID=A0A370TUY4_9HELO|nr:uncharacterized protein BP5553_03687 [Venustampulla echinocandica]RDL39347.1 hypothetical protein BP5553_03687 [Venustampulla echinocandica]
METGSTAPNSVADADPQRNGANTSGSIVGEVGGEQEEREPPGAPPGAPRMRFRSLRRRLIYPERATPELSEAAEPGEENPVLVSDLPIFPGAEPISQTDLRVENGSINPLAEANTADDNSGSNTGPEQPQHGFEIQSGTPSAGREAIPSNYLSHGQPPSQPGIAEASTGAPPSRGSNRSARLLYRTGPVYRPGPARRVLIIAIPQSAVPQPMRATFHGGAEPTATEVRNVGQGRRREIYNFSSERRQELMGQMMSDIARYDNARDTAFMREYRQ